MMYMLMPVKVYQELRAAKGRELLKQLTDAGNDMNLRTAALHAILDYNDMIAEKVIPFYSQEEVKP